MKKLAAGVLILLLVFPVSLAACSLAGCLDNGIELRHDFIVKVTHGDMPLPGVSVWVASEEGNKLFSGTTASNGTVRVADLPPGEYWLTAELLGVIAGTQCFHISTRTTRKAKKTVSYEWGDLAPATRQIAGRLIDSQPSQGGTPLWNYLHRVNVPISEARLKLHDPLTGAVYSAISDADGHFLFGGIPNGTYVLHIEKGTAPGDRGYDSTDLVIRLSNAANPGTLLLTRRDAGGGSCGGTSLELQSTPNE
ncbi:MAG: MSCRAMM family protein [Candidatus Acidiferrales bacterium]